MNRWATSAAALALTVLARSAPAQGPPDPKERWTRVSTAHFEVAADIPEKRLEEISRRLIATRVAIDELLLGRGAPTAFPTRIRVFSNAATLAAYRRQADGAVPAVEAVATVRDRRGRLVAVAAAQKGAMAEIGALLAGDRARQVLQSAPEWLVAGLAGNIRRLELDGELAVVPTSSAQQPQPPWPSAKQLRGPAPEPEAATEVVRRFLAPGSALAVRFTRYLELLRNGTREEQAWEAAFGDTFAAVLEQLRESGATVDLRLALPEIASFRPQRMSYSDLLVVLGDLLTRLSSWNTVAADLHFTTALEQVASLPTALRGVGVVRDIDGRRSDAAAAYDLSLAADATDPETLVLSAWGLVDGFRRSVGTLHGWEESTPDPIREARQRCRKALDLEPDLAIAHHCWGTTFLYDRELSDAPIEALRTAIAGVPRDFPADLELVLTLGHRGELDEAWIELNLRRQRLERVAQSEVARTTLVEDAIAHAASHVGTNDPGLARLLLERARVEAPDPQLDSLLEQLTDLEQKQRRDDQILLHNRAFSHLENGELDEARVLLERLLEQELPKDLHDSVLVMQRHLDSAEEP